MPNQQLARGIWAQFSTEENPFGVPNGMEENLRHLDDHLALYTLLPPQAPGTPLPGNPMDGDGQSYTDGSYATFNGGTWRTYAPRKGVRVVLASGTESWLNTGAGWEQFSVVDTGPAVEAAQVARTAAEAARDAALIQSGVYANEPTGRAAVADGAYFKVQGSGDVAAYEYRRVDASNSTLVATYPAIGYVAAVDWKVQNQQARIGRPRDFGVEVFNNAQFWNGASTSGATARSGGFFIPAGSSGTTSYIRAYFNFTEAERTQLAGRKIRFYVPLKTSTNFVSTGWGAAVQKQGLVALAGVTAKFEKIDATTWVFWWEHTMVGDETFVTAYFQRGSGVVFSEAFSVWAKGLYMMPQDEAGFREAVQANLEGVLETTTALTDWRDWGHYAEAWPKMELPRNNQGQIFNGAQWWDGSAVTATNVGGLTIPAGSTGVDSYLAWHWDLSADDRAKYAGEKFRVLVALKTTTDGFDSLTGMVHNVDAPAGGTLGTVSNKKLYKVSSTLYLLSFDYVAAGSEVQVRTYYQRTFGSALAADFGMYTVGHFVVPLDVQGFATAVEYYIDKLQKYQLDTIENVGTFKAAAEVFNGATVNTTTGYIDVPSGRTGENSYCVYQIQIHGERLNAGDTIQLRLLLGTTANYTANAPLYYGVNGELNGAGFTSAQVVNSLVARQISTTQIEVVADYVVRGGITEYVGLYAQTGSRANTSANIAFWPISVTYTKKDETANEDTLRRYLQDNRVDSGDLYAYATDSGEVYNGAAFRDNRWGVTIQAGLKGNVAYVGYKFPVDSIAKFKDGLVTVHVLLRTSVDFTTESPLAGNLSVFTASGLFQRSRRSRFQKLNSTTFLASYEYRIQGDELALRPYVQVTGSAAARIAEGFMTYAGMWVSFDAVGGQASVPGSVATSLADMALTFRKALGAAAVPTSDFSYTKTINVKPDGTGDYTTLAAAIAAEGGGTSTYKRVLYKVYEGIYMDMDTWFPDFVDVEGIGKRDQIWFRGYMPASTPVSEIPNHQTWYWNTTGRVRNVRVTCQNMRYPIHSDSGASALHAYQEIEDCYVEHLGNEEARAYQQANGGDPNAVWNSEHAWGCGTHSGQTIISRRTKWVSRTSPFYFHTNRDFAERAYVELDQSEVVLTTSDGWAALALQPLGSGTPDRLVVKGCHIEGRLNFTPIPILSQNPYNYRGNLNSEIEVYISASSPVAWTATNYTNVLELCSADAVGSSVVVSGTGADALFGKVPEYEAGGSGFAARVYSAHAIYCYNGFAGIGLGARLGNCTTTSKTLNIVFDGTISKTITLNQDFTNQSNATIIATLNSLLGDSSGRSFSEVNPYDGVAKVYQLDRELKLQNISAVVILKGQAVAFDGSRRLCRRATNADARQLVAGIALENIAPGKFGRVQKSGQFSTQQLKFSGSVSLAFGDTFGVSANAGDLVEGAAIPLLRVIESTPGFSVLELTP